MTDVNKENYQVMIDSLKDAKEQYEMFEGLVKNSLEEENISYARLKFLSDTIEKTDDVMDMDYDIIEEMILKIRKDQNIIKDPEGENITQESSTELEKNLKEVWIESLWKSSYNFECRDNEEKGLPAPPKEEDLTEEDKQRYLRLYLKNTLDDIKSLDSSEKDLKELEEKTEEVKEDYVNYMCSEDYENDRMKRVEALKEKIKTLSDDKQKKETQIKIDELEAIYSLSFITKRLYANPEKESLRVITNFFSNNRSFYVINRFKEKIKKVGFNENIYRVFFNLEEKYLDEKYHVFNNFFLFHIMEFISHIDINSERDRNYTRTIVSAISRLCYEKYSEEQRKVFIEKIEEVLSFYDGYRDRFEKDNVLRPGHPERIKQEKELERQDKEMIYTNLKANNIDISDEIKEMKIKELKEYYMGVLDNIEKSKENKELEGIKKFVDENKDTIVKPKEEEVIETETNDPEESNEDTEGEVLEESQKEVPKTE